MAELRIFYQHLPSIYFYSMVPMRLYRQPLPHDPPKGGTSLSGFLTHICFSFTNHTWIHHVLILFYNDNFIQTNRQYGRLYVSWAAGLWVTCIASWGRLFLDSRVDAPLAEFAHHSKGKFLAAWADRRRLGQDSSGLLLIPLGAVRKMEGLVGGSPPPLTPPCWCPKKAPKGMGQVERGGGVFLSKDVFCCWLVF